MAFNASVQQLGSGVAAFLAGMIVVKNGNGLYQNFNVIGYIAIAINVLSIFVISRINVKK
jgi:predicted MFS family arabinose efflux permease